MSAQARYRGPIVSEGKTKIVTDIGAGLAELFSKDDITAGDGKKHDLFAGKAVCSTETTCNVFSLLKACGIPVAFHERTGQTSFTAPLCSMWPYEVVIRRTVAEGGSYQKRHPDVRPGTVFTSPVVEFFLKTSGKNFRGIPLDKDDPLVVSWGPGGVTVVRPDMVRGHHENREIFIPSEIVYTNEREDGLDFTEMLAFMEMVALQVFGVLEEAWKIQRCRLLDLKIEFGDYMVGDVIDNDSWRLLNASGTNLDKQQYRDNTALSKVQTLYEDVAERSKALARLGHNPAFVSHIKQALGF